MSKSAFPPPAGGNAKTTKKSKAFFTTSGSKGENQTKMVPTPNKMPGQHG